MKLVISLLTAYLFVASITTATADPIITPAWQTPAVFDQPESVVFDAQHKLFYVSNVGGNPNEADGDGYLTQLSLDGKIIEQHWLKGLNAPKGMAIVDDTLYVSDINELVVINLTDKKIIQRHLAPQAKFLNDVAADANGNIFVSDMLTNTIHRLANDQFETWLHNEKLEAPNGLLIEGNQLIVASWGNMTDGFATAIPGHLKTIDIASKTIQSLGDATPAGNLDGVEPDGNGNYFVTDWMVGKLLHISPIGISKTLLSLDQGSADHAVILSQGLIIIPMMKTNTVLAYHIN